MMTIHYDSIQDLAAAMHRAETAHGEYEKTLGHRDDGWPTWYAAFMAREQSEGVNQKKRPTM